MVRGWSHDVGSSNMAPSQNRLLTNETSDANQPNTCRTSKIFCLPSFGPMTTFDLLSSEFEILCTDFVFSISQPIDINFGDILIEKPGKVRRNILYTLNTVLSHIVFDQLSNKIKRWKLLKVEYSRSRLWGETCLIREKGHI